MIEHPGTFRVKCTCGARRALKRTGPELRRHTPSGTMERGMLFCLMGCDGLAGIGLTLESLPHEVIMAVPA